MTNQYYQKRAQEILENRFCRPMVKAILGTSEEETRFFLDNERNGVIEQIITYLKQTN